MGIRQILTHFRHRDARQMISARVINVDDFYEVDGRVISVIVLEIM